MKTILYYTSNQENPEFERKIQANIVKQTNLPIVSVSQKPIDFGENFCVGDVGGSYFNEWRQILIGLKEIDTKYVVFAESDFLYPKDYFDFEPKDKINRYDNVWIVFNYKGFGGYNRKKYSEGAQICDREYLIEKYEEFFQGLPEWSLARMGKDNYPLFGEAFSWFGGDPCISFKTGQGVRCMTNTLKEKEASLPYWGDITKLKEEYLWKT